MMTWIRRVFLLGLSAGGGYAGWLAWQGRSSDDDAPAPEWPPLDPPDRSPATRPTPTAEQAPDPASTAGFASLPEQDAASITDAVARWVEPVDGACPDGYPVKANDNSMIFHVPGGRFYDRTIPERCYADPADAEADGYRRSKA